MLAERAVTRSPCEVVLLDVIAFGTGSVVVVDGFAGARRVPRSITLGHKETSFHGCAAVAVYNQERPLSL